MPARVEFKQAVAVRADLGMGRGKAAAQVGHACVMGSENARRSRPEWFEAWMSGFQKKVVVRVDGLAGLREVKKSAAQLGLPWAQVSDAGLTQLEPGTVTCVSVGPAPSDLVDRATGGLKLF